MMPLLRAEPEGFRERRVPGEFAGAFDGAAAFIAVLLRRRRGESGGIEKASRCAAADSHIWIADLLRAQRETCARAIVGHRSAQIGGVRRAGLPGNDILQPPVAENVFGPAVRSRAMMLAEGQLVDRKEADLMAHIERRQPPLRSEIIILLDDDWGSSADGAGIVERFRESVERLDGKAAREAVNQPELQRVVDRIRAGLIVVKAVGSGNLQRVLRVERAGSERRAIGRPQNVEISSLRAGVGQIQNPVLSE